MGRRAAVASLAWFAMHGPRIDSVAAILGGYGLLMVLAQVRLLPAYGRLAFMPGTWAFTFSWAAVATVVLVWLEVGRPSGYQVWQYAVIGALSLFIGAIAVRTVVDQPPRPPPRSVDRCAHPHRCPVMPQEEDLS